MENITEWTEKVGKIKRNKPTLPLQRELFNRIRKCLTAKTNTYDECVAAFCRFAAPIIDNFYGADYWDFSAEERSEWDRAVIKWAASNSGKQTIRATIRIVPIIKMKLPHVESSSAVLPELQWLSVNGDDRSASTFKQLRENSKVSDLRKLLDLDMNNWKVGQTQIFKMYGILFAESLDAVTKKLYLEFLIRHGKAQEEFPAKEEKDKDKEAAAPVEVAQQSKNPIEFEKKSTFIERKEISSGVSELPQEPIIKAEALVDGVALAEALVKWAQEQKAKTITQATTLADVNTQLQQLSGQVESLTGQIIEQKATLELLMREKAELTQQLQDADATIVALKREKAKAEDIIGQVQQMSGNSVKQELDGFKAKLASALANDVKDFRQEYTEEEKAEVYAAFMEDMISILKSHGVSVEE